jgi:AraC family transcriptional activator of tynA and feaB
MLTIETLSTTGIARRERLAYWNSIACRNISEEKVEPFAPADFWGRMRSVKMKTFRIVEVTSDPATVTCSGVRGAEPHAPKFLVHMQLHGSSRIRQGGREAILQPGDFTLCNAAHRRVVVFEERVTMLVLCLPDAVLRRRIACPETTTLYSMSGSVGPTAVAATCLRHIWSHAAEFTTDLAPRFMNIMLDLVGGALASLPSVGTDRSSFLAKMRSQIVDHIERRLGDSQLTTASISQEFGITPRHLYTVFGGNTESVARYILRRRLEESAMALADPFQNGRYVSEIAYDCGFRSLAHFCNVFRNHYKQAPGEYRRLNCPGCDSPSNARPIGKTRTIQP